MPTPTEQIGLLAKGIEVIGAIFKCSAVLSGYLGTEEQGEQRGLLRVFATTMVGADHVATHRHGGVRWDNIVHHACTEIRASALSGECDFSKE